jgi:hypothetical protein
MLLLFQGKTKIYGQKHLKKKLFLSATSGSKRDNNSVSEHIKQRLLSGI